ncbi:ImmA/IrrE family metallo-endopeptidase [Pontibacillus salicampi]|uniref:ImmA/IrrE family metallo-endopeptidase n=1 Tax=Pontibacillus salicampi TaxID=1449801 RepID=A0ABV6LTT8_9BACI
MKYQMTTLEMYVKELYEYIGINQPYQIDISYISKKMMIDLRHSHYDSQYTEFPGNKVINICTDKSKARQWEEFCHELGHALMHFGNQIIMPSTFRNKQEWQAHNFALHFSMPTFMLFELELPKYRNQAVGYISMLFGVTSEFASERLKHYENQVYGELFSQAIMEQRQDYPPPFSSSIDLHDDLPIEEKPSFKAFLDELRQHGATEEDIRKVIEDINYQEQRKFSQLIPTDTF